MSDFTHAAVLQVTIAGATLVHLMYRFAIVYRIAVTSSVRGRSVIALITGRWNVGWMMGAIRVELRTDRAANRQSQGAT